MVSEDLKKKVRKLVLEYGELIRKLNREKSEEYQPMLLLQDVEKLLDSGDESKVLEAKAELLIKISKMREAIEERK